MPPDVLQKNLRLLMNRHPRVYRQVAAHLPSSPGGPPPLTAQSGAAIRRDLRVLPAASGETTLRVRRGENLLLLHSRSDPVKEARRLAEAALSGTEELVALGGLGLGYLIEAVLSRCSRALVAVLEPDPGIFVKALESRDLSAVLGADRVALFLETGRGAVAADPTREAVAWWESRFPGASPARVQFLTTRVYRLLHGPVLRQWERSLHDFHRKNRINTATLDRFDRLWTRNTFRNAHLFFTLFGIGTLRDALAGIPAVVIGAGPSLEESIGLLREAREHVILIASDTVLLPLLRSRIVPDFTVTVDPQYVNSRALCAAYPLLTSGGSFLESSEHAPFLVADPAVHPASLRCYPGIRLLSSSVFAPGRIIERFSGRLGGIAAGGSVMTTAFDLARILGAEPIYLMGLDLCYRGLKTHLSGSAIQEGVLASSGRLRSPDTVYAASVRASQPVRARNAGGEPVTTDSRLLLYRSWFQEQSTGRVFNATAGGLEVEGIPRVAANRIREHRDAGKTAGMAELRGRLRRRPARREGAERFVSYVRAVRKNLEDVGAAARRGKHILREDPAGGLERGELEEVDRTLLGFPEENRLISMVMQRSIHRVLQDSGEQDGMDTGLQLYRDIEQASLMLAELLDLAAGRVLCAIT